MKIIGCERRSLEAERIKKYLQVNNVELVLDPTEADYIIYTTCGFDGIKEDQTVDDILELQKNYPHTKLIIMGCLPGINPERLKSIFDGESFSPANLEHIEEIFPEFKTKLADIEEFNLFTYNINGKVITSQNKKSSPLNIKGLYNVIIAKGCDRQCTYCGEWRAWGQYKSKPPERCIKEFKKGVEQGFKHINILADSIGPYGIDIDYNFPELLSEFLNIEGDFSIHLTEYSPLWIHKHIEELIPLFKTQRIISILVAIQSGSNKILEKMDRGYEIEYVIQDLLKLKKIAPELEFHTQVVVGFPFETEEDFELTLYALEIIKFKSVSLYLFDAKPGTPAAEFGDKISLEIKKDRAKKAIKRLDKIGTICYYYE